MSAEELERVARAHGIRLLLQFGSTVTGRVHERSDVDLAVLLERPRLSLAAYGELLHDLQRLFPGGKIDPAVINHADPLFLQADHGDVPAAVRDTGRAAAPAGLAFKRYQEHRGISTSSAASWPPP